MDTNSILIDISTRLGNVEGRMEAEDQRLDRIERMVERIESRLLKTQLKVGGLGAAAGIVGAILMKLLVG